MVNLISNNSVDENNNDVTALCQSIGSRLTGNDEFILQDVLPRGYDSDDLQEGYDTDEQSTGINNENHTVVAEYGQDGLRDNSFFTRSSQSSRESIIAQKFMQIFKFIVSQEYPFKSIIIDPYGDIEVTDEHIKQMVGHYPLLESFQLQDLNISSDVLSDVFQDKQSLTSITLSRSARVNDAVVQSIADNCPSLQYLNIKKDKYGDQISNVSDTAISYLVSKCPELKSLGLKRHAITDDAIESIARLTKLEFINLSNCDLITDNGVENLLTSCRELNAIKLGVDSSNSSKLTQRSLMAIANSRISRLWLSSFADGLMRESNRDRCFQNLLIEQIH